MDKFVCTGCSLLCDDVTADISKGEPNSLGLCRLGHNIFETAFKQKEDKLDSIPLDDAIKKATEILVSAKHPLCYGWTSSTNETVREGLALTATIKGFFDTPSTFALSTALAHNLHSKGLEIDLDAVREKGETVVFWGTNPAESSQRLLSKFAVIPHSEKLPEGVESRIVAVIDIRRTETMKMANHQIILEPNSDREIINALIGELSKTTPIKDSVGKVSAAELISFSKNLQKSDCTVFFYGSGLMNSGNSESYLEGISKIIQLLRDSGSEAYALPLTIDCNAMGALQNCQEITGFPTSVDFSSGAIEHNPQVTAQQKLVSGEFDAALIVGEDALLTTPRTVAKALANLPLVYIGSQHNYISQKATISLFSSENGISSTGTMNRMDQKEVTLMPLDNTSLPYPTEFELITKLHENVRNAL
jgi:formylmethanofuran dehydrogenase subunit B